MPATSSLSRALCWSAAALALGALSLVALQASRGASAALAERLLGGRLAAAAAAALPPPPATAAGRPLLPRPRRVFEDPPKGQDDSYVALCIAVKGEHAWAPTL